MNIVQSIRKNSFAYLFILPSFLVLLIFLGYPMIRAFILAFQDFEVGGGFFSNWVGVKNFREVFSSKVFWKALWNTVVYTVVTVPVNVFVALVLASLIHPLSRRARLFFRAAYYLPGVTSVVVISLIWKWLFNYDFGLFNQVLDSLGFDRVRWLVDVPLLSIILTSIVRTPGGPILIYLASLDAIPQSLYDSSRIDGAGPLRAWREVTFPLLRPTTLFLLITTMIYSFQVFAQVLILTRGGPGYESTVLVYRIYELAFSCGRYGVASCMALIFFLIIITVSILQFKFFRSEWEY